MELLNSTLSRFLVSALLTFAIAVPAALGQSGEIRGTVADTEGEIIPGANVIVEGSTQGATTNAEGEYQLSLDPGTYAIRVTFVGYAPQVEEDVEVVAGETTRLDFTLDQSTVDMEGLVVVGYGTQQERDLTGSVSSISAADIESIEATSINSSLQGRIAGVQTSQSASPGGGVSVRIRGSGSINASNEPLYVIDGIPIQGSGGAADPLSDTFFQLSRPSANPLSFLSPGDIESIDVLKDASATAIYGSRGANGVVIITTKQGQEGGTSVDFSSSVGVQRNVRDLEMLDAQGYAEYANNLAALRDDISGQPFDDPSQFGRGTDFQDQLYRDAVIQNYNLGVRGGNETTTFALSGSFSDQEGIVRGTDFRRYSIKSSIRQEISDRIRIGANLTGTRSENNQGLASGGGFGNESSAVTGARGMLPLLPVRDSEGNFTRNDFNFPDELSAVGFQPDLPVENPIAAVTEVTDQSQQDRVLATVFTEFDLAESLQLRVEGSANVLNSDRDQYFSTQTLQGGRGRGGQANTGTVEQDNYLFESVLTYDETLSDVHALNLTGGYTYERENFFQRNIDNSNFSNDVLGFRSIGDGTRDGGPAVGTFQSQWTLLSSFGRVNYTYDSRYLLTFTGRYDGSSKFGAENKWGFFPSGALGWRFSEEAFMDDADFLTDGKIRVSYGVTGNQEIGTYQSLAQLGSRRYGGADYEFGDNLVGGITTTSVANAALKWERSRQFNVGLDIAFLDDSFNLTADYYNTTTDDLLLDRPLPPNSGFGSVLSNIGSIRNRGVELAMGYNGALAENATWQTNINVSANRNEVIDIQGREIRGGGLDNNVFQGNIVREGSPVGAFYGYDIIGIIRDQEEAEEYSDIMPGVVPGQEKIRDVNGDGEITEADRTILGNPYPDYTIGWSNTLTFGNFDLYAFLQANIGNDIFNVDKFALSTGGIDQNKPREYYENTWTPENPDGKYPVLATPQGEGYNGTGSGSIEDLFIEDGSYLRAQNITLGYNIPTSFAQLDTYGFQSARVYVSATNVFTITDYSGPNPDVNTQGQNNINRGIDIGGYPLARTFRIGVRLGL